MDCRLIPLLLLVLSTHAVENCIGNEHSGGNCKPGRLLADSKNWAVGVIIIGIVGMLVFLLFVGYMIFKWKFSDDAANNLPPASSGPSNPSKSSAEKPAEIVL